MRGPVFGTPQIGQNTNNNYNGNDENIINNSNNDAHSWMRRAR
jgi:hypothetical protein